MEIKSDIQIAQEAHLENIKDVAAKVGVTEDELEMYGKYKAKLSDELIHRVENNEDGKLVLITAINPTPAGEGKTTISLGLTEALNQKGISAIAALREPSLGPCFGIKGGAAGGGDALPVPESGGGDGIWAGPGDGKILSEPLSGQAAGDHVRRPSWRKS